jgi:outer membrane protein assembly factor BamB
MIIPMHRLLILMLLLATPALADDWPQWRGPTHNGVSTAPSGYPDAWPPQRQWTKQVGIGCTSPVIAGGRLYTLGWTGPDRQDARDNPRGTDAIVCLDLRTGEQLWQQTYNARFQSRHSTGDERQYGGPSATPSFDPDTGYLYTLGSDGDLHCFNTRADGNRVWRINLFDQFNVPQRPVVGSGHRDFGYTCAPLIHGEQLIVEVGTPDATVIAFNKRTGNVAWRSQYNRPHGHTGGIVPMRLGSRDALALLTLYDVVAMDVAGRTIATQTWTTDYGCNLPTPAADGSALLVTSDYNMRRATLFNVAGDALTPKWQSSERALLSSPILHGGRAYLIQKTLRAVDRNSGDPLWRGGDFGHGSAVLTADNRLIVFGDGTLALVDATPDTTEYRELARIDRVVPGTCYPHVAFADNHIACKDRDGNLVVFNVSPRRGHLQ